jgi:hypothetical protein
MVGRKVGNERDKKIKAREKMAAIRAAMTPEEKIASNMARKVTINSYVMFLFWIFVYCQIRSRKNVRERNSDLTFRHPPVMLVSARLRQLVQLGQPEHGHPLLD